MKGFLTFWLSWGFNLDRNKLIVQKNVLRLSGKWTGMQEKIDTKFVQSTQVLEIAHTDAHLLKLCHLLLWNCLRIFYPFMNLGTFLRKSYKRLLISWNKFILQLSIQILEILWGKQATCTKGFFLWRHSYIIYCYLIVCCFAKAYWFCA